MYILPLPGAGGTAAGAEEQPVVPVTPIPLNEAMAAETIVVLTPETVEAGIRALSALQGQAEERVHLAAIVSDSHQAGKVRRLLETVNMQLTVPVVSLEKQGWNLERAISEVEATVERKGLNWAPVIIRTIQDLRDLAGLLVPGETSRQAWIQWLDQQVETKEIEVGA